MTASTPSRVRARGRPGERLDDDDGDRVDRERRVEPDLARRRGSSRRGRTARRGSTGAASGSAASPPRRGRERARDLGRDPRRVPPRREPDALGRVREPREVGLQLEGPAAVRPDHLVDAVAVEEPSVEDRDARLRGRDEGAVEVHERAHDRTFYTGCRAPRPRSPARPRSRDPSRIRPVFLTSSIAGDIPGIDGSRGRVHALRGRDDELVGCRAARSATTSARSARGPTPRSTARSSAAAPARASSRRRRAPPLRPRSRWRPPEDVRWAQREGDRGAVVRAARGGRADCAPREASVSAVAPAPVPAVALCVRRDLCGGCRAKR